VAQWGLKNILVSVGGDFIEVVSPFQPGTTAGRLLEKRGEGGYMIIMQTADAKARRAGIEKRGLANVIFNYEHDGNHCIQYHPKGIKGGLMPELDSMATSREYPDPVNTRFGPWHACGKEYELYSAGMKRSSHLQLVGVECGLGQGDKDTEAAAKQWEEIFGVIGNRNGYEYGLEFTNAAMRFTKGKKTNGQGLRSITIEVSGQEKLNEILERARREGVYGDGETGTSGAIWMLGVIWDFVIADSNNKTHL
jgi:hypothetical protein